MPGLITNCLPFSADDGETAAVELFVCSIAQRKVYLPALFTSQMMENLLLQEGDVVTLRSATLPKGTFVKLQVRVGCLWLCCKLCECSCGADVQRHAAQGHLCLAAGVHGYRDCHVMNCCGSAAVAPWQAGC